MENFATGGFGDMRGSFGKRAGRARANGDVRGFAGEFLSDGAAQAFAGCRDNRYTAT